MKDSLKLREQATQAAYARLRHLLYPDTVHLLKPRDLAEAITVACDILAPAENDAAQRLPAVLREMDRQHTAYLDALDDRDEALQAADRLAFAVGALVGRDVGRRIGGGNPWSRAMLILDEIAEANGRPRPSDLRYRAA